MAATHLIVFGLGYSGTALADLASRAGLTVTVASRQPNAAMPRGVGLVGFEAAGTALATATHLVVTAAPGEHGDPVLHRWRAAIAQAPLRWLGYLSTTGVYGNRDGAWVDEQTPPAPSSDRSERRLAAEMAWREAGGGRALDIFRLAGIYGPGRSAIDDLRRGMARRVSKPGHMFGRIHRDDIAGAVLAAILQDVPPGVRVFNLSDDEPAPSADVIAEAARLLGIEPPPLVPFAEAVGAMSPMALSFWADDRKVAGAVTQRVLGRRWLYPSYREGLRAIVEQASQGRP